MACERLDWGGVDQLSEFIEHASLSEEKIGRGTEELKNAVEQAAEMLRSKCSEKIQKKIAHQLLQENDSKGQTIKMAMAILVNALVFHITIAKTTTQEDVKNIAELKSSVGGFKDNLSEQWKAISSEINYRPIFDLAVDVLEPIDDGAAEPILKLLSKVATRIATMGATSKHDFGGQLFQKLINDRKFLASYYTLPSSAAFLAELAVSRMDKNWSDRDTITNFRVGDFSCGTGALLSATYNAMRSRYRRSGNDDADIHKDMMEKVLVGLDIMPAATHLTTSVLSSAHPTVIFRRTDIVTMLYGVHKIEEKNNNIETCIGSLDLICEQDALPLFATGQDHYSGTEGKVRTPIKVLHETFDLVIMNPPFKRPTDNEGTDKHEDKPNPAFGGLGTTDDDQKKMSLKRKEIYRERSKKRNRKDSWYRDKDDRAGEGRAGLSTWFMDLADVKVKKGGVVAFIIPSTFSNGRFWEKARTLLENRYRDILVVNIASSEQKGRAFSDDTGMAECIVVATRRHDGDDDKTGFSVASIDRRPASIVEAVYFARKISGDAKRQSSGRLCIGSQKFGRISHFKASLAEGGIGGITDADVEDTAIRLREGYLRLPHLPKDINLPIVPLRELGYRRKDSKYINGKDPALYGPFNIEDLDTNVPKFPALWAHDADANVSGRESRMIVEPDTQGIVREGMEEVAEKYWKEYSTRLCFNQDFQLTSQRLAACMTRKKVIGGEAWPAFICNDKRWNEPIVLWMNTTLGLISFWFKGTRQQKERSRVKIGALDTLPIYNMSMLSDEQVKIAQQIFKEFSKRELLQASRADEDPVRHALDKAVLVDLFGLTEDIMEPLDLLRKKWCNEPSVNAPSSLAKRRKSSTS